MLTWSEMAIAIQVGVRRQFEAIRKGLPDKHGLEDGGWNLHIDGACGEMAVAKLTGRYWDGSVNTFKTGGDVGSEQVRTRSKPQYELIVRSNDRDEDLFWLVTGSPPHLNVIGWIWGYEAKNRNWLRSYGNRPAAYFVPHAALNSFDDWLSLKEPSCV